MSKTKITIHRALSELKLIDAKIEKQITEFVPAGIYQKGKLVEKYLTEKDFKSNAESKYTSITDMIKRKTAIKSAIVQANGKTKVTVAGKSMTIADAINLKAVVEFKKALISKMKAVHLTAVANMNRNNKIVEDNAQKLLEAALGGADSVKKGGADVEAIRVPYVAANEFHVYDPLDVAKKVEALETEVSAFEAEVDAILSEINAVTFIEV